ncbi:PHA/PHB synthase family protein [Bradyrhizobium sp.]|uniref:PHA/PHB synthase family protein n=1 Tax=Bradyrhizobium sp. TaxID=376 RepID=UPI003C7071EC
MNRIEESVAAPVREPRAVLKPADGESAAPDPGRLPRRSAETAPTATTLDRALHAVAARFTGGLSPAALSLAFADWLLHLAASPGKQLALAADALQTSSRLMQQAAQPLTQYQPWSLTSPLSGDHRFSSPDWQLPAFNLTAQAFLLGQHWWQTATEVRGVSHANAAITAFTLRQLLDTVAPTNFPFVNPEVIRKAFETGGVNFVEGFHNWLRDCRTLSTQDSVDGSDDFVVGRNVATAKGKVVFRNRLIELIQYAPTTSTVRPEPVLIVPAWIMKYYILDLSPQNSLVNYLTSQGFTVFMISWLNPTADDRDLSIEDYRELGVEAALSAVQSIVPGRDIHAAGYCLGGTLLAIAAAAMSPERRAGLRTLTLLAAQTDFTEAGELTLFINESQVTFMEDMMWERGVLGTQQMAGAFRMLRSNDLIWSRVVRDYLLGERAPLSDLMAWNADATRMPFRMHADYLHKLFLHNDLAEGRYLANGRPIALSDLHAPMFVVGTERDHVAPWRSAHKIHFLADAEVTFVLASGGHNAGIVAPPTEGGHHYKIMGKKADGPYVGPEDWARMATAVEGSWWPAWVQFLAERSGPPMAPPALAEAGSDGAPLADAPGSYVRQR